MLSNSSVQRVVSPATVLYALVCLLIPTITTAQTPAPQVETYTGTTVNLAPGSGETVRINIFKWSSDADREAVLAAWTKGAEKELIALLAKAPTLGHVWDNGPIGYSVRFAQKIEMPDRTERIILVTDQPLGSRRAQVWKPSQQAAAQTYPFTLVELRITKARGEGKMSLSAKVGVDAAAKTLALENYAAAPVEISNVKRVAS